MKYIYIYVCWRTSFYLLFATNIYMSAVVEKATAFYYLTGFDISFPEDVGWGGVWYC